jgi:uncharacterized protein (DUF2342 family)
VEKNLSVPDKYSTHPPALDRIRVLLTLVENLGFVDQMSDETLKEVLEAIAGQARIAASAPDLKEFQDYL